MDFKQIINRALEIREKYSELEKRKYGQEWTRRQIIQGFVGDVKDLVELVELREKSQKKGEIDKKIAHELADCLWSVLVIADKYNVNIEKSFFRTMNELEKRILSRP